MEEEEEESTKSTNEQHFVFLDASDDFPFYDCPDFLDSPNHHHNNHQGLRHRRRSSLKNPNFNTQSNDFDSQTTILGSDRFEPISQIEVFDNQQQKIETSTFTFDQNIQESQSKDFDSQITILGSDRFEPISQIEVSNNQQQKIETSTVRESDNNVDNDNNNDNDDNGGGKLVYVAEFLVKAIGYQLNLLIRFLSFPFWVLYYTCMFAFNPLFVIGLGKSFLIGKVRKFGESLRPYVNEWLNEHKGWINVALSCGWGLFWSIYVCTVLITMLILGFVIGGLMMRYYVVEEPFYLEQDLNFDYTSSKPVAYVPILTCPSNDYNGNEVGNGARVLRIIPPKHKLLTTVTMVLPESDYNQNLGIFQVRVEFISENGKSLGTFRHPCMLEFKSQPLRLLLTFFKIVPLVAGYLSETQTLRLTFRGYTEGVIPTACLKITMEQRAEFQSSAGIPEIYYANIHVESELPFFKRMLWYWRRTIFVWLSMTVFTIELLCALICCRPVIIPSTRSRSNVSRSNPRRTSHSVRS